MFLSIGEIAAPPRRTGQPIRRNSQLAGRCEGMFWKPTDRQTVKKILFAAKRYDLAGKAAGSRNGPLGPVAIEILELFVNCVDFKTGRLDPSYEWIQRKLKRSRDAINRALLALREHGFLERLRRYVPTGAQSGPQVKQTSNAYRLSLPARAMRLLGRMFQPSPLPDDFSHAQAQQSAAIKEYRASLAMADRLKFDDHPFAEQLARMYSSMKKRESAKQTESQSRFII